QARIIRDGRRLVEEGLHVAGPERDAVKSRCIGGVLPEGEGFAAEQDSIVRQAVVCVRPAAAPACGASGHGNVEAGRAGVTAVMTARQRKKAKSPVLWISGSLETRDPQDRRFCLF